MTFLERLNSLKFDFMQNLSCGKMIKLQQSQALTSHFESFWSIVHYLGFDCVIMDIFWDEVSKPIKCLFREAQVPKANVANGVNGTNGAANLEMKTISPNNMKSTCLIPRREQQESVVSASKQWV